MRKINASLVLLTILILVVHGAMSGLCMLGIIHCKGIIYILGSIVSLILIMHIVISLILIVKTGMKKPPIKFYGNLNKSAIFQNMTGILIIIIVPIHVLLGEMQQFSIKPPLNTITIVHGISEIIFVTLICMHLYIGIPRLLVTYGCLNSSEAYTKCEKLVSIVLGLAWLFLAAGIVKYFFIPIS